MGVNKISEINRLSNLYGKPVLGYAKTFGLLAIYFEDGTEIAVETK